MEKKTTVNDVVKATEAVRKFRVELADRVYYQEPPTGFEKLPLNEHVLDCVACGQKFVYVSIIGKKKLDLMKEQKKLTLHTCLPCMKTARLSPEVQRLLKAVR